MNYLFESKAYYLVFQDGVKFEIEKELWYRMVKLKETEGL